MPSISWPIPSARATHVTPNSRASADWTRTSTIAPIAPSCARSAIVSTARHTPSALRHAHAPDHVVGVIVRLPGAAGPLQPGRHQQPGPLPPARLHPVDPPAVVAGAGEPRMLLQVHRARRGWPPGGSPAPVPPGPATPPRRSVSPASRARRACSRNEACSTDTDLLCATVKSVYTGDRRASCPASRSSSRRRSKVACGSAASLAAKIWLNRLYPFGARPSCSPVSGSVCW